MYTFRGSTKLERGLVVWEPEAREAGLRSSCVQHDVDFYVIPRRAADGSMPNAFVRFLDKGDIEVRALQQNENGFSDYVLVLSLPPSTEDSDAVEAVLTLLRLRVDTGSGL